MRNFTALDEKGSVREFIANDLTNAGLRIDTNKHRHHLLNQPSPHIANNAKQQQHGSRVFNVPLQQLDSMSVKVDNLDLTVPIFLRWCFDCIRRSIKHEGLFRKSGGSQRVKELMVSDRDRRRSFTLSRGSRLVSTMVLSRPASRHPTQYSIFAPCLKNFSVVSPTH